jgi:hypothetical protein
MTSWDTKAYKISRIQELLGASHYSYETSGETHNICTCISQMLNLQTRILYYKNQRTLFRWHIADKRSNYIVLKLVLYNIESLNAVCHAQLTGQFRIAKIYSVMIGVKPKRKTLCYIYICIYQNLCLYSLYNFT